MLVEAVAALLLLGLLAYALLGGADFGGGVWDLLASGPRADAQREAVSAAMGPVWEANHVWLIFVIVILFSSFPAAFGIVSIALFVPFHLVLIGIVLRGAAFVFRSYGPPWRGLSITWGRIFGVASLLTPLVLGMSLGAVASGRIRVEEGEVVAGATAWLAPAAWAVGLVAVAACAFLAACYLTNETGGDLREDFRRRAIAAWAALAALAAAALPLLARASPHLIPSPADPFTWLVLAAGALAAAAALWALLTRRWHLARVAAAAEVVILFLGFAGLMQFPYIVFPDVTLHDAAAPASVLTVVLVTVLGGMLVLLPALVYLFRVFKSGQRPTEM